MDFSHVKSWTIPEGNVKQVTDSAGNVIWQKDSRMRVGGRIFYVDTSSTGGTYTFYKQDGSLITTSTPPTITELADAYYYEVTGTPSKDKFYVYNNSTGIKDFVYWGLYGTQIGSSGVPPFRTGGIGYGKLNTNACLAVSGWESDSIFAYIQSLRDGKFNGCDDWFIGSTDEHTKLKESGLVNWYAGQYIISSVEYSAEEGMVWNHNSSLNPWVEELKDLSFNTVAFRAF